MKSILPIDIVPNNAKRNTFQWKQIIETVVGRQTVNHVGSVASSLESALVDLIKLAKQQEQEIVGLRRQVEQLEERLKTQPQVAAQPTVQTTKKNK